MTETNTTAASLALFVVEVMHLLLLPDELFLMEIFPYLHSADLIRAFGTLGNTRLLALVYAHIRHVDLPDEANYIEALRHYQWAQIRSLRVHEDHLDESIASIFPSLDQLIIRISSSEVPSISPLLLSLTSRLTHLRLSCGETERTWIKNRIVRSVWHGDSRIARLSTNSWIVIEGRYLPKMPSALARNEHLTHLSIIVADLSSSIRLIALSPSLVHLRVSLDNRRPRCCGPTTRFLEPNQWSSRVTSLHLTAYEIVVNTGRLCDYIRMFTESLERLTFSAHLDRSRPMSSPRSFEQSLLNHLPKLQHLDFCVHTKVRSDESENDPSFNDWKHRHHVISIFNSCLGQHTRFTLPFVFDRLERVTNDFVHFHSNDGHPNVSLVLPSVTSIFFNAAAAAAPLNLKLMSTIKDVCPRLQLVAFHDALQFHEDLIEDTQLTLPTVRRLCLFSLRVDDHRGLRRLLRLINNLSHLAIDLPIIRSILGTAEHERIRFHDIELLILVDYDFKSAREAKFITEEFSGANVIFRNSCAFHV